MNKNNTIEIILPFIFTLLFFTSQKDNLAQTDIPAGNVSGTWALSGSPFRINGEIVVPDGQTLTIEPGVNIVFTGHYKFNIQGRLLAVGNVNKSIDFTAQDTSTGWHGIRFINTPNTNDTSKIAYCSIRYGKANTGNDIDRSGGAIAILNYNKVWISNCLFESNMNYGSVSTTGGGAICLSTASPVITNCEFRANTSPFGAAILLYYSSNALIFNNHFHNNIGHGTINIGANSAPILMNNLIENNSNTGLPHGIIHFEGGSGMAIFINNTIANNECGGGAIFENDGSTPLFVNNIIYGNTPAQVSLAAPSALNFFYCLIEGGQGSFQGSTFSGIYQKCINSNPMFVSSNDFHLQNNSPCIGKGVKSIQISNEQYYAPNFDCEGNIRPNPKGSNPDLGAFENSLGSPITDMKEERDQHPDKFLLYQNYPNPFNPNTKIKYSIPYVGTSLMKFVQLKVYDILGNEVATLVDEEKPAGTYEVEFSAGSAGKSSNLSSGIYFYQLKAGSFISTKKFLLLK